MYVLYQYGGVGGEGSIRLSIGFIFFLLVFYKFSYLTQPYPLENRLGGGARGWRGASQ